MGANSNLSGFGGNLRKNSNKNAANLGKNRGENGKNFGANCCENGANSATQNGANACQNPAQIAPNSNLARSGKNSRENFNKNGKNHAAKTSTNPAQTAQNHGENLCETPATKSAQNPAQCGKTPAPNPPRLFVISNTPPPALDGVTHIEVMKIRTFDLAETLAGAEFDAVIFTSKHGVLAWREMRGRLLPNATGAPGTESAASAADVASAAGAKTAAHPALNANLVAFCLSEASAKAARGAGFARVFTPNSPNASDFAAKLTRILTAAASGGDLPLDFAPLGEIFGAKNSAPATKNATQNGANSNSSGTNGANSNLAARNPPRLLWVRGAAVAYELGAALRGAGFACGEAVGYENAPRTPAEIARAAGLADFAGAAGGFTGAAGGAGKLDGGDGGENAGNLDGASGAETATPNNANSNLDGAENAKNTDGGDGTQTAQTAQITPPRGSHLLFASGANVRAFAAAFGWDYSWHAHATGQSAAAALADVFAAAGSRDKPEINLCAGGNIAECVREVLSKIRRTTSQIRI